ncbi:MAG: hypothetical protein KTR15_14390 [Phycisphaeraceae bacterium]|nr:hypothetical protein [Phycisphaeraceae bacterium]
MNNRKRLLAACAASLLASTAAGQLQVNVDLHNGQDFTVSGPAVIGEEGDKWNTLKQLGLTSELLDSAGKTSTVGFFMDPAVDGGAGGKFQYGAGDPAKGGSPLMGDYCWISNDGANTPVDDAKLIDGVTKANYARRFTIFTDGGNGVVEDLDPDKHYNLYLYASGDTPGQGARFMLKQDGEGANGFVFSTLSASGVAWNGSFVKGDNYVVFEGVSPTAWNNGYEFEMSWFNGKGEGGAEFATFNGWQLVEVAKDAAARADFDNGSGIDDADDGIAFTALAVPGGPASVLEFPSLTLFGPCGPFSVAPACVAD